MTEKELEKRYKKVHFKKMPFLGKMAHCLFIYRRKILFFNKINEKQCKFGYEDKMIFWNPLTYIVMLVVFICKATKVLIEMIQESKNDGNCYTIGINIERLMEE